MSTYDPDLAAHKTWLNLIQPTGLVVSPPALVKAQAVVDRNVVEAQQRLLALTQERSRRAGEEPRAYVEDFPAFCQTVLGWAVEDLAGGPGGPPLPEGLEVVLPAYHDALRPTWAALDGMAGGKVLLLVEEVAPGQSFDAVAKGEDGKGWPASPQARFERLLRETKVPAGLLWNGHELRLVSAPGIESSGWLTFDIEALCEVSGRPLLSALLLLLSEFRVFSAPDGRRLLDILADSRNYQSVVSNQLAEQVLGALWDLLAGFQAADVAAKGFLIDQTAREDKDHLYGGLLSVLMRLVFLLYAEDRHLLPRSEVYVRNYSISGLFARLREDKARYPDTMDQRYGAWAALLSLFRLVYDGGGYDGEGGFHLPTRHGQLFNPDEFPFLEGRRPGVLRVMGERLEVPRVSDGCVHRVLEALLVLDGERLSYRSLDVEQIGSVYEAMMGFEIERAYAPALGVRRRVKGMPLDIVFNVAELLEQKAGKRAAWLAEQTGCDLSGKRAKELEAAKLAEDVVAAIGDKLSPRTKRPLPAGSLFLQPGEERRRSGSHYTPRELTEPIVATTLRPVLEALGERPMPDQILELKVCDPAMGSGAFLVEACRQLGEKLVEAWELHGEEPALPPDEDKRLHARRLVAQRCLYGVDKNPFAVNLAKLSLWLVTLARDHAFTFLDHALKNGDSLVGLSRQQIAAFHWNPPLDAQIDWIEKQLREDLEEALGWRGTLQSYDEGDYNQRSQAWRQAEDALHDARLVGDVVVAAFFGADKDRAREELRQAYQVKVDAWRAGGSAAELEGIVASLRGGERPVPPFHWELEFPEVFGRARPGFDVMVGNPPFLGGARIWPSLGGEFRDWLLMTYEGTTAKADLVSHFFQRTFSLLRQFGAFGLIATNSISHGDTRKGGLVALRLAGGTIFGARRRYSWPRLASVVVSVVHILKGHWLGPCLLDGKPVEHISSYLFATDPGVDPVSLKSNGNRSFLGAKLYGNGFIFDDADKNANSQALMAEIVAKNEKNNECIFPYIGGQELNEAPDIKPRRFAINFGARKLDEASDWPELLDIVRRRVKPQRDSLGGYSVADGRNRNWWLYGTATPSLVGATAHLERVLVIARISKTFAFAFLPSRVIANEKTVTFAFSSYSAFALLQSRSHEIWARFLGGSLKDDFQYTSTTCFETFPFPANWETDSKLEKVGKAYYEFRADLMIRNNEGLTKTYNRFHDPEERQTDIQTLRELHAAMDRAVLDAYGWNDIPTDCEFLLDYEDDEDDDSTRSKKKKKPYRYRWPESVHDEVLARLLDLNQKRYQEEVLAGLHDKKVPSKAAKPKNVEEAADVEVKKGENLPLFGGSEGS